MVVTSWHLEILGGTSSKDGNILLTEKHFNVTQYWDNNADVGEVLSGNKTENGSKSFSKSLPMWPWHASVPSHLWNVAFGGIMPQLEINKTTHSRFYCTCQWKHFYSTCLNSLHSMPDNSTLEGQHRPPEDSFHSQCPWRAWARPPPCQCCGTAGPRGTAFAP